MKLSIIVPVYNLENYIADTLDSLLAVKFPGSYEILVINDGSTDQSEAIIRSYQKENDNVFLFTIENQGVSNARNFGIQKASGEYLTFVDGDDTVEPDFFARAVSELDSGQYDFVQGNYQIIDAEGKHNQQRVDTDEVITDRFVMLEKFFGPKKIIHNSACGKVYRAELAKSARFDRTLRVAEDQKYVHQVLMKARKIKLLSSLCYHYYQRAGSAIHSLSMDQRRDMLRVLSEFKSAHSDEVLVTYIEQHEFIVLLDMYVTAIRHREDAQTIFSEISQLNVRRFFTYLDKSRRIHAILLFKTRRIYDFILTHWR